MKTKKLKKKHKHDSTPTNGEANGQSIGPSNGGPSNGIHHGDVRADRHKIDDEVFIKELARLQIELVKLQEWVKHEGLKVVVIFEGRDAAGKGGVIKRITESLNPRICRVVALGTPTEREKRSWYFQRYVPHLPTAGEIVLFDRSWYNRAGVERVMGFCSEAEYQEFLRSCPEFEQMLIRSGIILIKYWFSVSDAEQERRFQKRMNDPTRSWKLSPMDIESRSKWVEYSRRQRRHVRALRHEASPVAGSQGRQQEMCAIELHHALVEHDSLSGPYAHAGRAAAASAHAGRLHPPAARGSDLRARALVTRTDAISDNQKVVNQLELYKSSVHGKALAAGKKSAECVDCHSVHNTRAVTALPCPAWRPWVRKPAASTP